MWDNLRALRRFLGGNVVWRTVHAAAYLFHWHTGAGDCLYCGKNIYEAPGTPLVFGHLWLSKYNLHIDRVQNTIAGLSLSCHQDSLLSALRLGASTSPDHRFEPLDLSSVPSTCHGLANIFHKDLALSPPHHRPYARATDLLPGAPLPTSRLYSLSKLEQEAMEKYITLRCLSL